MIITSNVLRLYEINNFINEKKGKKVGLFTTRIRVLNVRTRSASQC